MSPPQNPLLATPRAQLQGQGVVRKEAKEAIKESVNNAFNGKTTPRRALAQFSNIVKNPDGSINQENANAIKNHMEWRLNRFIGLLRTNADNSTRLTELGKEEAQMRRDLYEPFMKAVFPNKPLQLPAQAAKQQLEVDSRAMIIGQKPYSREALKAMITANGEPNGPKAGVVRQYAETRLNTLRELPKSTSSQKQIAIAQQILQDLDLITSLPPAGGPVRRNAEPQPAPAQQVRPAQQPPLQSRAAQQPSQRPSIAARQGGPLGNSPFVSRPPAEVIHMLQNTEGMYINQSREIVSAFLQRNPQEVGSILAGLYTEISGPIIAAMLKDPGVTADKFYEIFKAIPRTPADRSLGHARIIQHMGDAVAVSKFAEIMLSKANPAERKALLEDMSRADSKAIADGVPANKRIEVARDLLALPNGGGLAASVLAKSPTADCLNFLLGLAQEKRVDILQSMLYKKPEGPIQVTNLLKDTRISAADAAWVLGQINPGDERDAYFRELPASRTEAIKAEMARIGII